MSQSLDQKNNQTFVFKGSEVIKTGRVARRDISRPSSRSVQYDWLYEVKPVNEQDGTWTEWVRQTDLYEIVQ